MIQLLGNKKYKRVYLSGPITGIENNNIESFKQYEIKFIDLDFKVINPHNLFSEKEINLLNELLEKKEITNQEHWKEFMKRDIKNLVNCDFIAMLPGWEKSKGANLELYIARNLFMPTINAETLQEIF